MKWAEVIINLPNSKFNTAYNYVVPEKLTDQTLFGKRVLVDFGGRKTEGYIVAEHEDDAPGEMKQVLRVLDVEAVFTPNLLALAQWMAEYYVCPLAMTLNLMVPKLLHQQRDHSITALIDRSAFASWLEKGVKLNREMFEELWQEGEISFKQALKYVSPAELNDWENSGFIARAGVYRIGREHKKGYNYMLGNFDWSQELPSLERRAPRQAQIINMMLEYKEIDRDYFDAMVSASSMKALLKKGFVTVVHRGQTSSGSTLNLNADQKMAVKVLENALHTPKSTELLLFGVTGSGKTEVYLRAAEIALERGLGVLILVPEIALTRQFVDIFSARIDSMAVLHSGMPAGERYDEWRRIRSGEARLVLGARSAVFAPIPNLGLIIIDEEQEGSFKQEEMPRYHVRDVARQRSRLESAPLLLGSATPSVETYFSTQQGVTQLLCLPERVGGGRLPEVFIEDLRTSFKDQARGLISPLLREKIGQNLQRGEQIILFINRRGYSPMTICWECGNIAACPACSVGMTYHRDIGQNVCHYCNRHEPPGALCQRCGSKYMQLVGAGTQRVEEEVRRLFPQAVVERLDIDSSRRAGQQKTILERMKSQEIDILIGTQMVAKGLDYPYVSLVGIVDADSILNLPDFRAGERCFQLLVQAAGRAGRSHAAGEVVIQTYNPGNEVIQMAAQQDYESFFGREIKLRQLLNYPPFSQLLRIVLSSESKAVVEESAQDMAGYIEDIVDASEEEVNILGPAPCPIARIRNRFRYQIIIKSSSLELLRSIAIYILAQGHNKHVKMEMDLNPITTI